jgi:FkbM family methyltransferase
MGKWTMKRKVADVVRDANLKSTINPDHHWLFDEFKPATVTLPKGFHPDYVGSLLNEKFFAEPAATTTKIVSPPCPRRDDEYFEWISLFASIFDADITYAMIELGAGFGRWAVRAALAARRRGLTPNIIAVEADPLHLQFCREHIATNGLADERIKIWEGAVSTSDGSALFAVEVPETLLGPMTSNTPSGWYGQSLAASSNLGKGTRINAQFHGRPLWQLETGFRAIEVRTFSLATILADAPPVIDLIDMDIQGEEGLIVPAFAPLLTNRVKRLHIETHSTQVEDNIRKALVPNWVCLYDFPQAATSETAFGSIFFPGGVQTWVNPKFFHADP